jgi:hypothetical protein
MSAHDQVEALKRAVAAIVGRLPHHQTAGQRWPEMFGARLGAVHQGAFRVHYNPPDPAARERARGLLDRILTPSQREEYRNTGRFTETVGGVRYRLGRGIEVLSDADEVVEAWCTYPLGLCVEDILIAQLLHLRCSPEALRRQAHVRAALVSRNAYATHRFPLRPSPHRYR